MNKDDFLENIESLSESTEALFWVELFTFSFESKDDGYQIPYFDALTIKIKELADKNKADKVIDAIKLLWENPPKTVDSNNHVISLDQIFSCFDEDKLMKYSSLFTLDFVKQIINDDNYSFEDRVFLILRMSSIGALKRVNKIYFKEDFFLNMKRLYPIAWVDILIYSGKYADFSKDIITILKENYDEFGDQYYRERLEIWESHLSEKQLEELENSVIYRIQSIKNQNKSEEEIKAFLHRDKSYPSFGEAICV